MKMIKKMWLLAAASLVAITSMAQAADDASKTNMRSTDAKKQETQMPEGYNPSARYAKKGYGPYVSGDFLWWKATQDDLQYTACLNEGFPLCGENYLLDSFKGEVREPDFQWDPGFRIGIGTTLPRDGWDIALQWTRFYTDAKDKCCAFPCPEEVISSTTSGTGPGLTSSTTSGTGPTEALASGASTSSTCSAQDPCGCCQKCCPQDCDCCCEPCCPCCEVCFDCCCPTSLVPTLCPFIFPDSFGTTTVATADWKLRLNLLDGEIGRKFFVSKWVTLRPFFGVRGTWIKQCYDVKYQTEINFNSLPVEASFSGFTTELDGCMICCSDFTTCYEGAGPRIGLNSEWTIAGGFGLYANAAISLIYGEYDFKQESNICLCGDLTLTNIGFNPFTLSRTIDDCARFELTDNFHSGKAITDLALGIQWAGSFAKDRVGLLIQIGYDHHLFFNQNPLIHLFQQNEFSSIQPFSLADFQNPTTSQIIPISNKYTQLSDRRRGDLSLQGLTVSARLDF